jgi:excisionase family DNA binding protein
MPEGSHLDDPPAMTVREVASYLIVDEKTVYRLAKRGELPGFKVAGTWRFRKGDIDGWIERQLPGASTKTRGKNVR